jgi:hypothetical protein
VAAIRDAVLAMDSTIEFPTLPGSMNHLTFDGANNIERILEIAYEYLNSDTSGVLGKGVLGVMVLGKEL